MLFLLQFRWNSDLHTNKYISEYSQKTKKKSIIKNRQIFLNRFFVFREFFWNVLKRMENKFNQIRRKQKNVL